MNLPDDLAEFYPSEDGFQMLPPDMAVVIICILGVMVILFRDFL